MEQELMRIGVSLPESLLTRFDGIIEQRGYSSRSEGIRDAIRNYIVHYEWMSDVKGDRVGVITMVYSHHQRGLVDALTNIQHEFVDIIQSTLHVHLDHDNCLEIVTLRGEGRDVRTAAEKMVALQGVKHVKLTAPSLGCRALSRHGDRRPKRYRAGCILTAGRSGIDGSVSPERRRIEGRATCA
jgi:CopG family nickel-responsive transcriptional regulator